MSVQIIEIEEVDDGWYVVRALLPDGAAVEDVSIVRTESGLGFTNPGRDKVPDEHRSAFMTATIEAIAERNT